MERFVLSYQLPLIKGCYAFPKDGPWRPGCVYYGSGATDQQIQDFDPISLGVQYGGFRPQGHDCIIPQGGSKS